MSRITLKQIICTPTYTTVILFGALTSFANAANLDRSPSVDPMSSAVTQSQIMENQINLDDLLNEGSTVVTAKFSDVQYSVQVSIN